MSKKEKEPAVSIQDTNSILKTISFQLERLIRIQEKRLSGEVIKNFNSKEEVSNA